MFCLNWLRGSAVVFLAALSAIATANPERSAGEMDGWRCRETTGTTCEISDDRSSESLFLFRKSDAASTSPLAEQPHISRVMSLEPGQYYVAGFKYKSAGFAPLIRVVHKPGWSIIRDEDFPAGNDWQEARMFFSPTQADALVLIYPAGSDATKLTSATGKFKDIYVRKASDEEMRGFNSAAIKVDPSRPVGKIDKRFFGANTLFWIEDDAALADENFTKLVRDLGCKFLRFPGGEVADNYHWKTHRLDDGKYWPAQHGDDKTDTDEFMAWCRELGAEPIFVVNLDSSQLVGKPEEGVREATEWVRYCNIEKGYNVKHWEIGNETYLKVTRYPMTAREYAGAVRDFSKAMKAVDPTIQVGAVGPMDPEEIVPFDQIRPELRDGARAPSKKSQRVAAVEKALAAGQNQFGDAWWPTVCEIAGEHFDFAVVHQYQSALDYKNFAVGVSGQQKKAEELDEFFRAVRGHSVPLALTEWNVSSHARVTEEEQAVMVTELIMAYVSGGVDMANFWPLRGPAPKKVDHSEYRPLLVSTPLSARPNYYFFKAISTAIGDELVFVEQGNPGVSVLASKAKDGGGLSVFVLNKQKSADSGQCSIAIGNGDYDLQSAETISVAKDGDGKPRSSAVNVRGSAGNFECKVPPMSLTTFKFRHER